MDRFIGVKIIHAKPMTKYDYHKEQGHKVALDELDLHGYMVKYEGGYVSWSPKHVFERHYLHYPEVGDGKVSIDMVNEFMDEVIIKQLDNKTTLASAETLTGFTQHETSACVSPEDYNHEVGGEIATQRIRRSLWMCLGFVARWGKFGLKTRKEK